MGRSRLKTKMGPDLQSKKRWERGEGGDGRDAVVAEEEVLEGREGGGREVAQSARLQQVPREGKLGAAAYG